MIKYYIPANTPDKKVAIIGVLNFGWVFDKNLNIKPSLAIAYKTLGRGNIAPSKLNMF